MFRRVLPTVIALFAIGCSGGARSAPTGVVQTARQTTSPTKCTRRHVATTADGKNMMVYTEDTGSCEPVRPVAVTRVAAE